MTDRSRFPIPAPLIFAFAILVTGCFMGGDGGVDVAEELRHEESFEHIPGGLIEIDWASGDIDLVADEGAGVRIVAVGWKVDEPLDVEDWIDDVRFERLDDRLLLSYQADALFSFTSVSLQVRYPADARLRVNAANGDVMVDGGAELSADTANGGLTVRDVTGGVHLDSSNGDLEVSAGADASPGPIHCESSNGGITIDLAGDHDGEVICDTANGGVILRVGGAQLGDVELDSSNGSLRLEFGTLSGDVTADSGNGSIDVLFAVMPPELDLLADCSVGGLETNLPGARVIEETVGGVIERAGEGPRMRLSSSNGAIAVMTDE